MSENLLNDDVVVSLPFSRLMSLLEPSDKVSELRHDIDAVRREMEGVQRINTELMIIVGDLKRKLDKYEED